MRCSWADRSDIERSWHDNEWGRAVHDDRRLFELLVLKGAQAGLAWRTVLGKRCAYRQLFHEYDVARIAQMDDDELARASVDKGIIRHRLKVASVRANARVVAAMEARGESLSALLWSFTDGRPIVNAWAEPADVPMRSDISDAMSLELQRRGFQFAGTAICYGLMQSAGMVDDHLASCDCHGALRVS
ncbi:DNA-3-methyladenine glycosylase I [Luteibacter pinisoli]|uniref:DNA-3-methyladenine glycosylase I n=1 Tax=Luteibacter pinisoli TaxID=2589080 RepID=A0A4Y5Z7F1_9GAMM|nr:DNA-3-methyladenine glycosylase I [Luteibacter pinisoli]QDE41241.1 DNA-3-methyladenine glycosylase I [Luteibacter pinisoli]